MIKLMDCESGDIHKPVNVGNPGEFSMNELALKIEAALGKKLQVRHLPLPEDDPKQRKPDISRASEMLGWAPTTTLSDGLDKTIGYFKQRLESSGNS